MLNRVKKRHLLFLLLLAAIAVFGIFYIKNDQNKNGGLLRPYEKEQDFKQLVMLVNANKFWLSENPNFNVEKFFLEQAPKEYPDKKGELKINVIEADNKAVAFITYYKKTNSQGFIWIMGVDQKYRRKGYARRLMLSALKYFDAEKVKSTILHTRTINKPALSLYKSLGFLEKHRNDKRGMVTLVRHSK